MVYPGSRLDEVIARLDALASEWSAGDNCDPTYQEDWGTLTPTEERARLEEQSASPAPSDPVWFPISRSVTADKASLHVGLFKPALREGLARASFAGQHCVIQVGFNETMLQQGTLLEEIHLLLDGNLALPEQEIYRIFAPIFAPFPAIVYTPGETFYVPTHTPSQNIPGRRIELRGLSSSNTSLTTQSLGSSGNPGEGSEDQEEKSAKDDSRVHRKMQDGGGDGGSGDSSSDDDDDENDKGKKGSYGGRKRKRKQRRPRVINIPFKAKLLTMGLDGEFITRAGVDITVRFFSVTYFGLGKGLVVACCRSTKIGGLVQLIHNGGGHGLRSK